jgi:hypothetical protein
MLVESSTLPLLHALEIPNNNVEAFLMDVLTLEVPLPVFQDAPNAFTRTLLSP